MRGAAGWRRALVAPLRALFAAAEALDRLDLPLLSRIPAKRKRRLAAAVFRRLSALVPDVVHRRSLALRVPRAAAYSYLLREHEPETQGVIAAVLRPGMVAVDVGANVGYLTLLMASAVTPGGRVVALEPAPDNLALLTENVRRNRLDEVVRVLPVAAGAERGRRPLQLGRAGTLHTLYRIDGAGGAEIAVDVAPLDGLIEGAVDLVKIDVEGAEHAVLDGMARLLAAVPPPRLLVEWSPSALARAGSSPESLPRRLEAAGYRLSLLDPSERPGAGPGAGTDDGIGAALDGLASGALDPSWHANLLAEPADRDVDGDDDRGADRGTAARRGAGGPG